MNVRRTKDQEQARDEVGDGESDYEDVGCVPSLVTQRHGNHQQVTDQTNDRDAK